MDRCLGHRCGYPDWPRAAELIIGDRNVGKTALALDIVVAQHPGDVACVYVVIGQPMSRVLALRETLERAGRFANTAIIAAHASTSRECNTWRRMPGRPSRSGSVIEGNTRSSCTTI